MGLLGGGQGGGGMSPVVKALLLALAVKAVQSHMAGRPGAQAGAGAPAPNAGGGLGGILGGLLGGAGGGGLGSILGGAAGSGGLGGLGGLLGGGASSGGPMGGLGGLLGGLGGAGGLGALVSQFTRNGQGHAMQSWVGTGDNQPIAADEIEQAIGPEHLAELEQQTGLPRAQLLPQLAADLPDAINHLTPDGRLPTEDELHALAARA